MFVTAITSAGQYTSIFSNQRYQRDTGIDTGNFLRYQNTTYKFFIDNHVFLR